MLNFAGIARLPNVSTVRPQDTPAGLRALKLALYLEIFLAALEGPIRHVLHMAHADPLIFFRDAFLFATLLILLAGRVIERQVPTVAGVFLLVCAIHGTISLLNVHSVIPMLYGVKLLLPMLAGFLASSAIYAPGPRTRRVIAVLWIASVVGAVCDQFWVDFPWVGEDVEMGGVDVSLGRDWQSSVKRVGGLTRASINLAIMLPLLSFMLMQMLRSGWARAAVALTTVSMLYCTTQKGAILGYMLSLIAMLLARGKSPGPLRVAAIIAAVLLVMAPTVFIHFQLGHDQGVFSFESFIERLEWMWPNAWRWIDKFPPFLGVGLGGIGGGQRFFAPSEFNAADNLFVFMYGNFGIASVFYLVVCVWITVSARVRKEPADMTALASMVFLLMYGVVISLLEDQIASLWLGASLGWLAQRRTPRTGLRERQTASAPGVQL